VYRGSPPEAGRDPAADAADVAAAVGSAACGVSVVALGGAALLECGAAWEMDSCWEEGEEGEEEGAKLVPAAAAPGTAAAELAACVESI
jgi:hypothetical protein